VRSPRCWPIRAREFSAAWEAPPRLGLSDMSSLLHANEASPQRPPEREISLNHSLHESIHELPGESGMVRAHIQDFDIELSRPNGHTLRKMEQ
jgi:hypothetical protein